MQKNEIRMVYFRRLSELKRNLYTFPIYFGFESLLQVIELLN